MWLQLSLKSTYFDDNLAEFCPDLHLRILLGFSLSDCIVTSPTMRVLVIEVIFSLLTDCPKWSSWKSAYSFINNFLNLVGIHISFSWISKSFFASSTKWSNVSPLLSLILFIVSEILKMSDDLSIAANHSLYIWV